MCHTSSIFKEAVKKNLNTMENCLFDLLIEVSNARYERDVLSDQLHKILYDDTISKEEISKIKKSLGHILL